MSRVNVLRDLLTNVSVYRKECDCLNISNPTVLYITCAFDELDLVLYGRSIASDLANDDVYNIVAYRLT